MIPLHISLVYTLYTYVQGRKHKWHLYLCNDIPAAARLMIIKQTCIQPPAPLQQRLQSATCTSSATGLIKGKSAWMVKNRNYKIDKQELQSNKVQCQIVRR